MVGHGGKLVGSAFALAGGLVLRWGQRSGGHANKDKTDRREDTGWVFAWLLLRLLDLPKHLYRHGWGWVLGHRVLQLTHRGRRTGLLRRTVLEVMHWDPTTGEAIVMSGSGPTTHWLRNIQSNDQLEVNIGHAFFAGTYRLLAPQEAIGVLADYERRNVLLRPLVHAFLGHLGGGSFDGSDSALRKLAYQLPMVAVRPLTT